MTFHGHPSGPLIQTVAYIRYGGSRPRVNGRCRRATEGYIGVNILIDQGNDYLRRAAPTASVRLAPSRHAEGPGLVWVDLLVLAVAAVVAYWVYKDAVGAMPRCGRWASACSRC